MILLRERCPARSGGPRVKPEDSRCIIDRKVRINVTIFNREYNY